MKTLIHLTAIVLGVVFFSTICASAGDLTIPNTFTADTPAVAAEVNANFDAAKTAVDDNNSRITANTNEMGLIWDDLDGVWSDLDGMPGIAYSEDTYYTDLSTTPVTVRSATLTAPTPGFIVAMFSGIGTFLHSTGTPQTISLWLNTDGTNNKFLRSYRHLYVSAAASSAYNYRTASSMRIFPVHSAGNITVYLQAEASHNTGMSMGWPSLVLMFFPRLY